MIIADTSRRTERRLAAAATIAGTVAWIIFLRADLVLSHYDAKAHLVVARRVIDNLTPGWQQIGAVWLPLPHLLQLLPVQNDVLYRTGASGSLLSIICFGITTYAFARLVLLATASRIGAATSTAVLVLNPNLLYLHATPMTEPLLLAVTALVVLWMFEWAQGDQDRVPVRLGVALFAATWTRYEAWPIVAVAAAGALFAAWRRGIAIDDGPAVADFAQARKAGPYVRLARRAVSVACWPAAAVALFLLNSRITVGSWFVSGGFYVPDPLYKEQALRVLTGLWWGTHKLSGYGIEILALLGAAALVVRALRRREDGALLVPLALFAAAALPFYAFYAGHPYRIRYMIPLVAACALSAGLLAGVTRRWAPLVMALVVASALIESPPWDRNAQMILEAQWDRPASRGRAGVSRCLARDYRGERVLASMGSLAHYMQELSWYGFQIADFVHEGNGVIWHAALDTGPAPHAGWMLIEEAAEGGDVLAQRIRTEPRFANGMTRVCEGGGVALYRRSSEL